MYKSIPEGTRVRIIAGGKEGDNYHNFRHGAIVTIQHDTQEGSSILAEGEVFYDGEYESQTDTQFIRQHHFELIAAKIDFTKPVQTKDGQPVEIVKTDGRGTYPVLGYVGDSDSISTFTLEGRFYEFEEDDIDLMNVPEAPKEFFLNIYKGEIGNKLHETREQADEAAARHAYRMTRIACVKVVDGQFDA